jgi:hypothetical protein
MAYTAGFSVSVGDPTKASDVTTLAANDDYLKAAVDGKAALSGSTNNTVATVTGANALIGEADLTFAANKLTVFGTTGTGAATASVLNLSTRETTVVDADQLGRIEFQAPAETGSDAVLVAASIYAEADVTFDATNNATDLVLATAHDGAAAERVRITSQGEIGLAGANYGTDGQVMTSAGAGAAAAWETIPPGTTLSGSTNNTVATVTAANALIGEANLTFDGTDLAIGNAAPSSYMNSVHGLVVGDTSDATSEITIATTTSGVGELNFTDTADATNQGYIKYDHSDNGLQLNTADHIAYEIGGNEVGRMLASGTVMISETSNTFMSLGLTIEQDINDNEILALKSSDVAHGMTDLAETDTYGTLKKSSPTLGGVELAGYSEATRVIVLQAMAASADTTKTTGANAPNFFLSSMKSGTTRQNIGADGNLACISNNGSVRFIFDAEGSGHADVGWTTYDKHDDLTLISDMEDTLLAMEAPDQTPRRHAMEATGIIGKDSWHMEDGKPRAMVNFTKLAMLHHGALIQTGDRFKMLEDRLEATEAKLLLAQSKLDKLEIN